MRAADAADWIRVTVGGDVRVAGTGNVEAAARSGVVVLAVPYDVHDELVHELSPHLTGRVIVTLREPAGLRRVRAVRSARRRWIDRRGDGGSPVRRARRRRLPPPFGGEPWPANARSLREAVMVCGGGDAACDLVSRATSRVARHGDKSALNMLERPQKEYLCPNTTSPYRWYRPARKGPRQGPRGRLHGVLSGHAVLQGAAMQLHAAKWASARRMASERFTF